MSKFKLVVAPEDMITSDEVRSLMKNATKLGEAGIVERCRRRLFEIAGEPFDDPLHRRFWQMIAAYEELLTTKNGKKTRANRTRQKVEKKGIISTLQSWVHANETTGFETLMAAGLPEYTGEYIILEFPQRFEKTDLQAAIERLNEYEVDLPEAFFPHAHLLEQ